MYGLIKERFPYDDSLWHHYYVNYAINVNLKQLLLYTSCEVRFYPLKQINIHPNYQITNNKYCMSNPWCNYYDGNRLDFCKTLINEGMILPLWCFEESGKLYLREGFHRIDALNIGMEKELLPHDFKVCCLIVPPSIENAISPTLARPILMYELRGKPTDCAHAHFIQIYLNNEWECFRAYNKTIVFLGERYYGKETIRLPQLNNEQDFNYWLDDDN